ncbi:DUF938 domain-containing protein [uncultured Salinisphaera sp.]|uniref:DUF938 domain-containing protein n=1 Tax=uncultured Salinisphaera sp. TaxID=359372 RepID=UPI0032B2133A
MSKRIGDCSAAERNKEPIFDALLEHLANAREVLEVGAGDATHARYALERLPHCIWQTSEAPGHHRRLVAALADSADHRLPRPLALDVRAAWPRGPYDAVFGANVAHIMDWAAVEALFAGAATVLRPAGRLCLYGPFLRRGETPRPGNATFDAALRDRDPAMGLREIEALNALAQRQGLVALDDIAMPSDNRLLIWQKSGDRIF